MSRARVLMLTGEFPPLPGGIADYTLLLRDALFDSGAEVVVMAPVGSAADLAVDRWSWRTAAVVRSAAREHACDIIHIQYQAGAFEMHPVVNMLPRLVRDVPVVTTFHDLRPPYLFPKARGLRYAAIRRMARWSSIVIVTNPADARVFAESGIESEQIPLGPSLPPPEPGIVPAAGVGFFGFPSRQKGFGVLVEALSLIDRALRPELVIVGGLLPTSTHHGFYSEDDVDTLARAFDVSIRWTGFLDPQSAANALAACAVIAFPFPAGATLRSSAMIAALSSGRQVITTESRPASDLGSLANLPQLITVPSAEPQVVADAIRDAIEHPPDATDLPDDFYWHSIAERHRDVYASLLREASA